MKYAIGALFGAFLIISCGTIAIPVHEYVLDVKSQMLRGMEPKDDKPLSFCDGTMCYVYEDADVRKIKKYIVELETRLKACEKP